MSNTSNTSWAFETWRQMSKRILIFMSFPTHGSLLPLHMRSRAAMAPHESKAQSENEKREKKSWRNELLTTHLIFFIRRQKNILCNENNRSLSSMPHWTYNRLPPVSPSPLCGRVPPCTNSNQWLNTRATTTAASASATDDADDADADAAAAAIQRGNVQARVCTNTNKQISV